ncbi:MAG: protein kinase [archaeon]
METFEINRSLGRTGREIRKLKDFNDPALESILSSSQYKLGREIGRGTWGRVYSAEDTLTGQNDLAIKLLEPTALAREQMAQRNLTELKAVTNESRRFAACSNVVPGEIDLDDNGKPFIIMPRYDKFLSDVLNDEGERKHLGNGIDLEQANKYLLGIAKGLSEVHNKLGRVHGDLKPDNIALDNLDRRPMINDLGTSTCGSYLGRSVSPRDNMGFIQTRDPTCFKEGSHPTKESDSYSFFALAYRILSNEGKYPFEQELMNDPNFFDNTSPEKFKEILKEKLKHVPKSYRKILENYGDITTTWRSGNGSYIVSNLEEVIENQNTWKVLKDRVKKVILPVAVGSAILGGMLYASVRYEPNDIKIPNIQINGPITLEDKTKGNIVFDKEDPNLLQLPQPSPGILLDGDFSARIGKYVSDNRIVVALLDSYQSTIMAGRAWPDADKESNNGYYTPAQWNIFQELKIKENMGSSGLSSPSKAYRGEIHHQVVARSLEYALRAAVRPDGKVDLEDTLAISLEGERKINMAKRAANSFDFRKYISAKDESGKYIISEKDQKFLKTWLIQTYYKEDPRAFSKGKYPYE